MKKQKVTSKKMVRRSKKRPVSKIRTFGRFLPAILITLTATALSTQPVELIRQTDSNNVLAYATNISISGLLSATNTQRTNNSVKTLALNSKLNSAAQAKANDMVAKDYWSHVSPDGKQPWWFITNAGYSYTSAGENLAYGFMTSSDTVTGWMNSPSHKANLLSTSFTQVGFGFANSSNYVGDGKQTVVVAMYAKPTASTPVASSTPKKSTPAPQTAPATYSTPTAQTTTAPKPEVTESPKPAETKKEPDAEETIAVAPTSEIPAPLITAAPSRISRIQLLTLGNASWSASALVILVSAAGMLWIFHKGLHLKRYFLAGEHFFAHHIHLDLTVLSIVYLGFVLLASSGAVR